MKKTIYAFIITAALTVSSAANALVSSNLNQTTNQTVQTEFKKVCEVCPYADEMMCQGWTPTCTTDDDLKLIDPIELKTCPLNCTTCNKITGKCTVCATGYAVNTAGNCIKEIVINPDLPVIDDPIIVPVVTSTVSSCPSGTTKSSDGCCCVNN